MVDHGRLGRKRRANRERVRRAWDRSTGGSPSRRVMRAISRMERINGGYDTAWLVGGGSGVAQTARNAAARTSAGSMIRSDAAMLHDYLYNNGSQVTISICDERGVQYTERDGSPTVIIVDEELAGMMLATIAWHHRPYTIQEILLDAITSAVNRAHADTGDAALTEPLTVDLSTPAPSTHC